MGPPPPLESRQSETDGWRGKEETDRTQPGNTWAGEFNAVKLHCYTYVKCISQKKKHLSHNKGIYNIVSSLTHQPSHYNINVISLKWKISALK